MPAQIFRCAETAFLAWLSANPHGFVVNTTAKPSERYYVLHTASCTTLHRDVPAGGYTERDYIKACSADPTPVALEHWIRQNGGAGFTKICAVCKPPVGSSSKGDDEPSELQFAQQVAAARKLTNAERAAHLVEPSSPPAFYVTTAVVFARSAYVVAQVLERAAGHCERCGSSAPFVRKSDGSPYLEVHHQVHLADGGYDSVANALALCPNCHRKAHFGESDG